MPATSSGKSNHDQRNAFVAAFLGWTMDAFNWMSHGTQDVYPTFLKSTDDGGADGSNPQYR